MIDTLTDRPERDRTRVYDSVIQPKSKYAFKVTGNELPHLTPRMMVMLRLHYRLLRDCDVDVTAARRSVRVDAEELEWAALRHEDHQRSKVRASG